jgi:hypothetical protein
MTTTAFFLRFMGQDLPVWSRHLGDPILESNMTRHTDFAR